MNIKIIALIGFILVIIAGIGFSLYMARKQAITWVHPARNVADETPQDVGLDNWEDIQFTTSDGLNIDGWFIQADASGQPKETIILLHGLGGHRGGLMNEAVILARHGYNTLLIDMRNHGTSDGTVTTLGYAEIEDVRGAVDYLLTRDEVNPERIGIIGFSLGGVVALRAAARIPEIQAVVAESAFKSVEDAAPTIVDALTGRPPFPFTGAVLWFVTMEASANVYGVRPIDDLAQITPRPVLFIHGEQDPVVLVSNSQDMFAAAGEPKELYVIPNAAHGGFLDADSAQYEERLAGFFDQYLRDQ